MAFSERGIVDKNNKNVRSIFSLLREDKYCLLYNGNFIDEVTEKIINVSQVILNQRGEKSKIKNRFSFLVAECFQNIIRHGGYKNSDRKEKNLPGFFMVNTKDSSYNIVTGNLIANKEIPPLKSRFEKVNSMSKLELKKLYNQVMEKEKMSKKGGAGLGLIEMARKSDQELEYRFLDYNSIFSVFYQRLVMYGSLEVNNNLLLKEDIYYGMDLHREMIDAGVVLLHKGDFSKDSAISMINIVKQNLVSKVADLGLVEETYYILFDLLQNMSSKGLEYGRRDGSVFFVKKIDKNYVICYGNYVDNSKVSAIRKFVDRVNSMNEKELKSFFLRQLMHPNSTLDKKLKEKTPNIEKLVSDRFSYSFYKVDNNFSFFSVQALI